MYGIARTHEDFTHPHAIRILNHFQGYTKNSLSTMQEKEWVEINGQEWSLTQKGFSEAKDLYNQQANND